MHYLRRILFSLSVFLAALAVFGMVRSCQQGGGALDWATGGKTETFTPPSVPRLAPEDTAGLARLDEEYTKLSAAVLPSVVSVNTKMVVQKQGWVQYGPFRLPGVTQGEEAGLGSGAIISKEGHVVTNWHVINGASEVRITTNDNKTYQARVLDGSETRDIALLKIVSDRTDFPALTFADSDKARVGQIVFAVGNPFGLTGTVTQGIISARDRHLNDSQLDYLQTDTVINPGNSGGPLVNVRGEILGVNVAIYRGDQNVGAWQGVGLAVPANEAKQVVDSILALKAGRADKATGSGYLGVSLAPDLVLAPLADGRQITAALVQSVNDDSPAAAAGIRAGDAILGVDGKGFNSPSIFLQWIRTQRPGTPFKLTIWRNGRLGEVSGKLGETPR